MVKFVKSQFAFENWAIQNRKKLLQRFRDATHIERELINQDHVLINLFMLRRGQDPGFCSFVYKSIKSDKKAVFKAKKLVLRLLSDATDDPDELLKLLDSDAIKQEMISDGSQIKEKISNRERIKEFYLLMRKQAIKNNEYDEIFAIDSILNEYKNEFKGFDVQISPDIYKDLDFSDKYKLMMKKFTFTQVKQLKVYNESKLNLDIIQIIDFLNPFFSDLIIKHLEDLLGESLPQKAFIAYTKLLRDIMSVISIDWFSELDMKDKLAMLNKRYELSELIISIDPKELITSEIKLNIWFRINILLNNLGYHNEASKISLKISELDIVKKNIDYLNRIYDDIAFGYKKVKDIKKAITAFKFQINFLIKSENPKTYYNISIAYKNIAELYQVNNDQERAEEYFKKAMKHYTKLSNDQKYKVLFNLSMSYQRLLDFKNEKRMLEKILQLPANHKTKRIAKERLVILDNIPEEQLIGIYKKQELDQGMKNGKIQFYAWNFSKAIQTYSDLLNDISSNLDYYISQINSELGRIKFELLDFNDSAFHFNEIIANKEQSFPEDFYSIAHLIAIGVIIEDLEIIPYDIVGVIKELDISEEIFTEFFEHTVILILLGSKENYKKSIESLRRIFSIHELRLYSLFSQVLHKYGYCELAVEYLNKGLSSTESKESKEIEANLLLYIGIIHNSVGNFSVAIDKLEIAKELYLQKEEIYIELANAYASVKNYSKAIVILKEAKKHLKNSLEILSLLEKYESLIQDVLNFNEKIPKKYRIMLSEGEKLYQNYLIMEENEEADVSSVVMQYSKFVESVLDYYIAYPFYQSITKHGWKIRRSDQFLYNYKRSIKKNNKKQISIGQWGSIINRFDEQREKNKPSLMEKYIIEHSDHIKKDVILKVCSSLTKTRNLGVHKDITELRTLKQKRPEIIQRINLLIDMVIDLTKI